MSARRPLGVRLVRPYASRQQLLEAEGHLLGRSHALLLGVRPLPSGTCLRFELQLCDGTPLGRAECLVVQPVAHGDGLALRVRLLRVDATIKTLLDEAVERRPKRAPPASIPRQLPHSSTRWRDTLPAAAGVPPHDAHAPTSAHQPNTHPIRAAAPHDESARPSAPTASGVQARAPHDAPSARTLRAPAQSGTLPRHPDRDELLARLRARLAR